jgi:hypothetical protein
VDDSDVGQPVEGQLHGEHRDGSGFGRGGDQDDDSGWVEQVGHGQREHRDLHRVLVLDRVTAAVRPLVPEHHCDRNDQQNDPAGDAQRTRREMQQPAHRV